MWIEVWNDAAALFSKKNGHRQTLAPYSRTWAQVVERVEHVVWDVWNDKYGPLEPAQREYAIELIRSAFKHAAGAPTPSDHYAWFHARLMMLANHETVDAGFRKRATQYEPVSLPIELRSVPA